MIDMKRSKSELNDQSEEIASTENKYPWGLNISLNEESLSKLDFDGEVGEEVVLLAKVTITSKSEYEHENEKSKTMDLQITEMELKKGSSKSLAKRLYPDEDDN